MLFKGLNPFVFRAVVQPAKAAQANAPDVVLIPLSSGLSFNQPHGSSAGVDIGLNPFVFRAVVQQHHVPHQRTPQRVLIPLSSGLSFNTRLPVCSGQVKTDTHLKQQPFPIPGARGCPVRYGVGRCCTASRCTPRHPVGRLRGWCTPWHRSIRSSASQRSAP